MYSYIYLEVEITVGLTFTDGWHAQLSRYLDHLVTLGQLRGIFVVPDSDLDFISDTLNLITKENLHLGV